MLTEPRRDSWDWLEDSGVVLTHLNASELHAAETSGVMNLLKVSYEHFISSMPATPPCYASSKIVLSLSQDCTELCKNCTAVEVKLVLVICITRWFLSGISTLFKAPRICFLRQSWNEQTSSVQTHLLGWKTWPWSYLFIFLTNLIFLYFRI